MYKTRIPHINVMKKLRWEGIQLFEIFVGTFVLVGRVEDSRVGAWCSVSRGLLSSAWIFLLLILCIHDAMDFLYYPHVDMVRR